MSLCSFAALRKDAQALLALINKLPQREWEKRLHGIFVRDPVQGPLAVAWMLQQVHKASTRQDAPLPWVPGVSLGFLRGSRLLAATPRFQKVPGGGPQTHPQGSMGALRPRGAKSVTTRF